MPKEILLDAEKLAYIDDVLSRSGILGRQFRMQLADRLGETVLLCDPTWQEDNLEAGGVCKRAESIDNLVLFIEKRMKESSDCALFFNECARSADPGLRETPTVVTVKEEVYHFLPSRSTPEEIRSCVVQAETGIALVGILFNGANVSDMFRSKEVLEEAIQTCATCATYLVIGVHDGESYLTCRVLSS
jgi:hypothetical protein